jgi:hypothetical protein
MLSLERCKEILNQNSNKYSDEKISKIRDLLYQLAKFDIETFKKATK